MKTLSATLLAAQKKPDRLPYVEAKVYDFDQGIKRLSWTRLYTGSEPDNHHGIAFDGQGSMHRIRVAEGSGGSYGANLGTSSTIEAYKSQYTTREAIKVIDGIKTGNDPSVGMWLLNADGPAGWITIDLGANYNVGKVTIYNYNEVNYANRGFKDFKIYLSTDNTNWTEKVSSQLAQEDGVGDPAPQSFTFTPMSARYVKFDATTNWGGTGGYSGLTEIEVYEWIPTLSLYRQKITSPGPSSDYATWTLLANNCQGPCAIAAYGARIYIFYRTTANVLWKYYSHDYGVNWSNAQLVTAYTDVLSMAACWWGTGNIVVCFAFKAGQQNGIVIDTTDQATTEHTWLGSSQHPWGNNYGAGCYYTPDHIDLVIAAWESQTPYNLYGLYRQQFDNTYTFTDVDPFITSPEGEGITYEYPDCHLPSSAQDYENTLIVGVEKYTGVTAYTRPLICHAVRGSDFYSMAFTEPRPFLNIPSSYGMRLQSTASYWWLERPDGVWRSPRAAGTPLDLTPDIISISTSPTLTIELDNSKAQYATPPERRSEIALKLGYKTTAGNEAVEVGRYWLDSWEYSSSPNISILKLFCLDGQGLASQWSSRFLMRWPANKTVWEIIQEIICRWGINLTMPAGIPYSSASQNLYPDFTLPPGTAGDSALRHILSFIPDSLVFTGNEAYLKDPRADEASSYSYGTDHIILQGEYHQAIPLTRARAIGRDAADARIVEDAIDWTNLQLGIDIFDQDYDPNLLTTTRTQERADAILRKESLRAERGNLAIPPNVGQELYDVVTVTDKRCGITSKKYRVMDIDAEYSLREWQYRQTFALGAP
jgi:hypothetical protein